MKTISKRELNQQTARVLAAVDAGETVIVTERGVARWRIEPVTADPITRLRAEGRIVPAKSDPSPWPNRVGHPGRTPAHVDAMLEEMRGER